jgi:hypothetical protein
MKDLIAIDHDAVHGGVPPSSRSDAGTGDLAQR